MLSNGFLNERWEFGFKFIYYFHFVWNHYKFSLIVGF